MYRIEAYTGIDSISSGLKGIRESSDNYHFNYLKPYLKKKKIRTIVFEYEYRDKDYIEDFARYYSRCFNEYGKQCIRVHFFKVAFDSSDFESVITNPNDKRKEKLLRSYEGFVVFRPIPHTIFGRTCLKAPESDNPNASFHFITREYTVHLFGLELKFESLAFQEQDNAVSACATAALWFMFQCTCKWINHPILSPYEITLKAKEIISSEPRKNMKDFRGLSIPQMVHVIKQLNIEPFILQPSNNQNYFKAQIYAYLKGKIPIIVGARLNGDDKDNLENHAMTLTGYGINTENSRNFFNDNEKTGLDCINMYSSLVDRLFVHDDQLGPFGDLLFSKNDCFRTSLTDIGHFNKKYASINANVFALIYPLLPKIRIDFDEIFGIIREFQRMSLHNALIYGNPANVIAWDLYLSSVCDLKAHFSQDACIEAKVKLNLLTKSFPRHIWVIDAVQLDETGNKEVLFSLYFDATDISNGNLFICSLHRTSKSVESIKDSISHCKPENHHVRQILQAYDQKKNTSQIFTSTSIA